MKSQDILDSYIISMDEIAVEGYNRDTKKAIRSDALFNKLYSSLLENKKRVKEGTRKRDISILLKAKDEYTKLIPLAKQVKNTIDNLPEPRSKFDRFMGVFFEIGNDFNFKESSVLPTTKVVGGGYDVTIYETIHDKLSDTTDSHVKETYQYKLNLLLVDGIPHMIRDIDMAIERIRRNPKFK